VLSMRSQHLPGAKKLLYQHANSSIGKSQAVSGSRYLWVPSGIDGFPRTSDAKKTWYEKYSRVRSLNHANYLRLKRCADIVLGSFLLFLTLPVLAICMIAVILDSPGPVLFVQERSGRGGKQFKMFKLRTMLKDAATLKHIYQHLNVLSYPDFKIPNDPRITRVGHFLRKTSLDELPQFFNVIRGDMSLVGPRPTSFSPSTYASWHTARLEVKPGITGLWQIAGRCNIDFHDRVRLDIAYVRNQCLFLDIQILLRTPICVIRKVGAQ
jgi:lipopolysaccharide/colanic/teichoic acid biosynthesis glycosyltransferase